MIAVLTGDIINSRNSPVVDWMPSLKKIFNHYGQSSKDWEIFRGDSFQLKVDPKNAVYAAIQIKSILKQLKKIDVRIAIGIGEETHNAKKITESNGSAYILSGESFDSLKKQTLSIKTNNNTTNLILNLMFDLAMLTVNNWSTTVAVVIKTMLEYPNKTQKEISNILNKSQSSVSEALKRGGYEEIMNLNNFYLKQLDVL